MGASSSRQPSVKDGGEVASSSVAQPAPVDDASASGRKRPRSDGAAELRRGKKSKNRAAEKRDQRKAKKIAKMQDKSAVAQSDNKVAGKNDERTHSTLNVSRFSKKGKQLRKLQKKKLSLKYLDQPGDSDRPWTKRLIVLDVNGFLLYRSRHVITGVQRNGFDSIGNNLYDRPYVRQFLKWLQTRGFYVALWTSATAPVAESLRKHLFTGNIPAPLFCFSQKECISLPRSESTLGPVFSKPLSVVWDSDVAKQHGFDKSNTIILDDSFEKQASNLANCIITRTFNASSAEAVSLSLKELGAKGSLWAYLDGLARHQGDVQTYIKEKPYSLHQQ